MKYIIDKLYHLAERENVPSILRYGLMSTEKLLEFGQFQNIERTDFLRRHRNDYKRISDEIVIRDQRPMPPEALANALADGLDPSDWYELINSFVFFWVDLDRVTRLRRAISDRPQTLLTFDALEITARFGDSAFVSPINTGNARRRPAKRGLNTIVPYQHWVEKGWMDGRKPQAPAELLIRGTIPVEPPYLLDMMDI